MKGELEIQKLTVQQIVKKNKIPNNKILIY